MLAVLVCCFVGLVVVVVKLVGVALFWGCVSPCFWRLLALLCGLVLGGVALCWVFWLFSVAMKITDRGLKVLLPVLLAESRVNPSAELDKMLTEVARVCAYRGLHSLLAQHGLRALPSRSTPVVREQSDDGVPVVRHKLLGG